MAEILCSVGAIISKPNGRNFRLLDGLAKQLECDGFEFMMEKPWYRNIEELKVYLKEIKLYCYICCVKRDGRVLWAGIAGRKCGL